MARWDADARSLSEALRAIGEAIQGSGRTYQQQEDAQTRRIVRDPRGAGLSRGGSDERSMGRSR